jgi:hypothetical protein
MLNLRLSSIRGRHRPLYQLQLTDIRVLSVAWHSGGPRLGR